MELDNGRNILRRERRQTPNARPCLVGRVLTSTAVAHNMMLDYYRKIQHEIDFVRLDMKRGDRRRRIDTRLIMCKAKESYCTVLLQEGCLDVYLLPRSSLELEIESTKDIWKEFTHWALAKSPKQSCGDPLVLLPVRSGEQNKSAFTLSTHYPFD